jgi:hypothetical protein
MRVLCCVLVSVSGVLNSVFSHTLDVTLLPVQTVGRHPGDLDQVNLSWSRRTARSCSLHQLTTTKIWRGNSSDVRHQHKGYADRAGRPNWRVVGICYQ